MKTRTPRSAAARTQRPLALATSIAALLGLLAAVHPAPAVTTNFNNAGASSWFTGANWDNGVPTAADIANIITGTAQIGAPGAVAGTFQPSATVTISAGGTLTAGQTQFATLPGAGLVTVDGAGATFTNNGLFFLSSNNSGTLTIQNGGLVTTNGDLQTTSIGGTTGTINLNTGGTLQLGGGANGFNGGLGTDVFNFAGGTLRVITANLTSTGIDANMTATSTIDTNGLNMSFAGVISGAGGLNKNGAGTLTLTGTNTYNGTTAINAGKVIINNSDALSFNTISMFNGTELNASANATLQQAILFANAGDTSTVSAAAGTTLIIGGGSIFGGTTVFGSTGNTGVVQFSNTAASAGGAGAFQVAFGTLRNDSVGTLNFFTTNGVTMQVDATGTLDLNDNDLTLPTLTGSGSVTLGTSAATVLTVESGTFSGVISGAGNLTKTTAGTLALTGTNTYSGGTNINAGVLSINNGSALGTGTVTINAGTLLGTADLTLNIGKSLSAGSTVAAATGTTLSLDGATSMGVGNHVFGSAGNTGVVSVAITGSANVLGAPTIQVAFGTLRNGGGLGNGLSFFTENVASTTVDAGATLDANGLPLTINQLLGAGTLTNNGAATATYTIQSGTFTGGIQNGTGQTALTKSTAGVLNLSGALTYTGTTTVDAGTLNVDTGGTARTLGALVMNGGTLGLDNAILSFSSLSGAGGTIALTATGGASQLTVGTNNLDTTFGGAITSTALTGFVKEGTGKLTLTGASAGHTSTTTINGGTLATQNAAALGTSTVELTAGTLAPTNALNVGALNWTGGTIQLAPGVTPDVVNVTGAFNNGGAGGAYTLDATGLAVGTTYTLTTFGTTDFVLGNFSAAFTNAGLTPQGTFLLNANNVQFTLTGATATGNVIQNTAPVNTPTFADFQVNGRVATAGGNNTINSLVFTPGGSLTVNNTLFVTRGPVNLPGGSSILLNGFLSASQLNMFVNSFLGGNGGIIGDLINNGLVSPGNSPGVIRVSGNYRQSRTGTLRIEIGGTSEADYDRLTVGGTADLDGRLELVRLNNFKLKRGNKIVFLTAAQGVNGEFAEVSNPFTSETILEPTVVYGDTEVSLELVRGSFEDFADHWGLTPNQHAVAKALDSVSADEPDDEALVYLDGRKLDHLPGDFDKIAPEELTSMLTVTTAYANVQSTNLQRRTADVRAGSNGFNAAGLAMNGSGPGYSGQLATARPDFRTGAAGPTGKESKEIKDVAPAEDPRLGVFLSGTGEWVDVNGNGNARGFDLTTGGFTLGLDYRISPNFALGIAAGYAGSSVDLTNNGRVWVNGGKLGLYATYFTGGFYVDAAVNGGYNSFDTKRSALQGTARGSTDGGELNVLFGTGYDWKIGALSIGPTATFQYTYASVDGFTERGSLAPLNIAGQDTESLRSALGFKASYDWKLGGVIVRPEVRAAWQHEYGDTSTALTSSFANGAGNAFSVTGPQIGRDSLLLGAGVAVQWNERTSTYVYYDGELFRSSYDSHSVSGGVRMAF